MKQAVLMSIKPKWVRLIASGQKTVEVRKTRPKIVMPFKCYIYETQGRKWQNKNEPQMQEGKGRVVGEFVCDKLFPIFSFSGSRFWLNETFVKETMLEENEILRYAGGAKEIYGWHISNLKIYDKPKPLSDFIHPSIGCCNEGKCRGCKFLEEGNGYNLEDDCAADFDTDMYSILRRPPQSWCYVEELP